MFTPWFPPGSPPGSPSGSGPGSAPAGFDIRDLDAILVHAARQEVSDIVLQTRAPVIAELHGRPWPATGCGRRLGDAALASVVEYLYGRSAPAQLVAGADLNCSHAARDAEGRLYRFRVNITPVLVAGSITANVVIRVLPHRLPRLEAQGLPPALAEALVAGRGLSLVTGVPGSGKSTLLAAVIRHHLEAGFGRVQTYEAPIEFTYDSLGLPASRISQTEIPTHLRDFATGVRSSLRRAPAAILVGEARERGTVAAVIDAADFGIATYTTTHATGVANAVRRLLAEFSEAEREGRALALLEALNVIVTQHLAPSPAGGRTALREWLIFGEALKDELAGLPHARWSTRIAARLTDAAATLGDAAAAAVAAGTATPAVLRRIRERL